jgi:hypothetical protein
MALIDIQATIKGSADASAMPIRIITAVVTIAGKASSGTGGRPTPPVQPKES